MHTCRNCNQSFQTELALELHRDTCSAGQLFCQVCGDRFSEAAATEDGWHYACPNDDCEGSGLKEDLYLIEDLRTTTH
ncbi:HVO_2901 family zinc finger protein [Natrarchaeobaculum aegyptiacum]|uniref:Transcriptional regulator n=1 Tax=Natrarchaeobaculum aegyptiacum TaxID=745377 RepID=A0A2Z2I328_9EURY|nr:HVO_2901 family zinc finger protein [Natrarchaeobaculum aegyptiacum]ARS91568.1 transcriptional regulator [Natrarchaeobaculum aegyptiacum]